MRNIDTLVWHCTAVPEGREQTLESIRRFHMKTLGWKDTGYHGIVHLDGSFSPARPIWQVGSHVKGHNTGSIGYAYVGGLDAKGRAKDTRTTAQKATMRRLTIEAIQKYGVKRVVGHRDLSPDLNRNGIIDPHEWTKMCPCFDAIPEYRDLVRETLKRAA